MTDSKVSSRFQIGDDQMRICRKCNGSGWYGPRTDLGRPLGNRQRGGPCRTCNGTGSDNRWSEKSCRKCYGTIEYRTDWSNVPDYCETCRKDQYKSCANPHCNGTVRYKVFWDHIPDYCQCKGWFTTTCQNSHCGQQFQANCNWTDPPKYCKTCKGWFEKDCATRNCDGKVRVHYEWTPPPEYCETCKKLGGKHRDPWKDPRNRIERRTGLDNTYHEKIVEGPDIGAHRGYDRDRVREFEAGKDYARRK